MLFACGLSNTYLRSIELIEAVPTSGDCGTSTFSEREGSLSIVEAGTHGWCHYNSTRVLFHPFRGYRRVTHPHPVRAGLGSRLHNSKEYSMIPAGVDVDDIAEQLSDDGVAFSNPELALDDALQEPIAASL